MKEFEVFFTETVRRKVIIEDNSLEEAKEKFYGGDFAGSEIQELDVWDAEIE